MQNADEYLNKTRSAVAKLFEAIDTYLAILREHSTTFVTSYTNEEDWQKQYAAWHLANESKIQAAQDAQKQYLGESFAQATLCGAVLQIAAKAIECYSTNTKIPKDWENLIKPESKAVPFCAGRLIRGIPLGLVIYAARNQHTHFEDQDLREPNAAVFLRLAANHDYVMGNTASVIDPAFYLSTKSINSFASNVTSLIGWRSVETYESDMRQLLEI